MHPCINKFKRTFFQISILLTWTDVFQTFQFFKIHYPKSMSHRIYDAIWGTHHLIDLILGFKIKLRDSLSIWKTRMILMARKETAYVSMSMHFLKSSKKLKRGSNKQSRVNFKLNLSIFQITTFEDKINNYKRP